MGFNSFVNIPDLTTVTRKRKVTDLTDPTQNYNYNTSVPSNLPATGGMPVGSAIAPTGNSKMDILSNIMQAIASGYAVSQSDNPAQTIMQQMMQRRQEAMAREQQQYELLKQQNQIQAQKESQATQIKAEKEAQQVDIGARKEAQQSQQTFDISRDDARFKNNLALQKDDQLARLAAQKLSQDFTATQAQKSQDFQLVLQEARDKGDIKQVEIKTVMGALLSASKYHNAAPIGQVMNIVNKLQNNIALTPEDTAAIDKAIKINASAGVGAGTKFAQKSFLQQQNDENDIIKGLLLHSKEPVINPQTGMPMMDFQGRPIMQNSDPSKLAQEVKDAVSIYRAVTGHREQQQQVIQQGQQIQNTPEGVVNNLINQGQSPQQIINMIDSSGLSNEDKKRAKKQVQSHFKVINIAPKTTGSFLNYKGLP